MSVKVKEKVHSLKEDLRDVEVNGICGNLAVGWWVHPMKFFGDPGKSYLKFKPSHLTALLPPLRYPLDSTHL